MDGAVIVAELVRALLRGEVPSLEVVGSWCESKLMARAISQVSGGVEDHARANEMAELLGHGTKAHEVVPLALFHLYQNDFDFETSLLQGLNTYHRSGLDSDSILGLAGALPALPVAR